MPVPRSKNANSPKGFTRRRLLAVLGATGLLPSTVFAEDQENLMCGVSYPVLDGSRQLGYQLANRKAVGIAGTMRIDLMLDPETPQQARNISSLDVTKSFWSRLSVADANKRSENLYLIPDEKLRNQLAANIEKIRSDASGPAMRGWLELKLVPSARQKNVLIPVRITLQLPPLGNTYPSLNFGVVLKVFSGETLLLTGYHKPAGLAEDMTGLGPAPDLVMNWDHNSSAPTEKGLMVRTVAQALLRDQDIRIEATTVASEYVFHFNPARPFKWSREYPTVAQLQPYASRVATAAINGDVSKCEKAACFLTTAAVDAVGLNDDCWELETLRRFRDGWLSSTPEGSALIADYYRIAPDIVARINQSANARFIWWRTYAFGILPAAVCARLGWRAHALSHYRNMVRRLEAMETGLR